MPFAAPPVRENRWRAPRAVKLWEGILRPTRKPAECVQDPSGRYDSQAISGTSVKGLRIVDRNTELVTISGSTSY